MFTRQKAQPRWKIILTGILLSLIHVVQLIALFNVTGRAGRVSFSDVSNYLERDDWQSLLAFDDANVTKVVHEHLGASEVNVRISMSSFGFCLTYSGYLDTIFNVTCGIVLIYLFIFADMWRVIWNTTITRQFPGDPNYQLMMFGTVWLVTVNATILTWLGVESGLSVLANSGEFITVLLDSLIIFIILALDDAVLPLIRFLIEEAGHMDEEGEMDLDQLDVLTHGSQYYKPGYGHHWGYALSSHNPMGKRIASAFFILLTLGIVIAPLSATIVFAVQTFVQC